MKYINILIGIIIFTCCPKDGFGQQDDIRPRSKKYFPYKILFESNESTFSEKEKQRFEKALQATKQVYKRLKKENYIITLQPSGCDKELKDISLHIRRSEEIIKYLKDELEGVIPIIAITFNYLPNCWDDCDEGCPDGVTISGERLSE